MTVRAVFGPADGALPNFFSLASSVRMKIFRVIAAILFCLLPAAHAQDADARYVSIYNVIQQADNLASGGQPQDALNAYTEAQTKLQKFQKLFPNWDQGIVAYRLDDLEKKISALKTQLAPKKVEIVEMAVTNAAAALAQSQ